MERRVPLSRAAQLAPFLDLLGQAGARIELGLERNKLPPGLQANADTLIAARAMSTFIEDMGRREGITDFGWLGSSRELAQIPVMAPEIRRSQTLYQALKSVCALGTRESSNIGLWIEEREESILLCFQRSVGVGAKGADEVSKMQVAVALSIVRLFAAPDWTPTDCALAIRGELGPIPREALGNARIRRAPDYSWFRLPRSILSRPLRVLPPDTTRSGIGPDPAQDLVGSLVQALGPLLARGAPSIRDAAELAGTSARTLQRELACAGCSYMDVLLEVKLDRARELLEKPDVKIADVAHETGFSDPAHFTRFFRALSGVAPREYRTTHLAGP